MSGISMDENNKETPWMTYGAIQYLQEFVNKELEVFEFGSGASTLFFARNCQKVTSIETNKFWHNIISQRLEENNLTNSKRYLMEDGLDNENYENFLHNLNQKFDIIIIDSIKRYQCAIHIKDFVKENGIIILDDSERKNYQKIFDYYADLGFQQIDFEGIAPGQFKIKNTTIFKR
ncbi:MAG: class I SAM-dependent methyltransferase [Rickettsiales bacterium]|nr:class I SAM-dependent methyltransferase [Rickettsiales bacterium]